MTPAERRAALVEKVARALCSDFGGPLECNPVCPCCVQDATAALTVALEEAAQVADECRRQNGILSGKPNDAYHEGIRAGSEAIAAAIRVLIPK